MLCGRVCVLGVGVSRPVWCIRRGRACSQEKEGKGDVCTAPIGVCAGCLHEKTGAKAQIDFLFGRFAVVSAECFGLWLAFLTTPAGCGGQGWVCVLLARVWLSLTAGH